MKNIITIIREKGLSVAEVAKASGLSRVTIYAMRKPGYSPKADSIIALAGAIGCKPSDLYPGLAEKS